MHQKQKVIPVVQVEQWAELDVRATLMLNRSGNRETQKFNRGVDVLFISPAV